MKKLGLILFATLVSICLARADAFLRVPLCRQAKSYTCGVAAMQCILFYYDSAMDIRQDVLEKSLRTTRGGTKYRKMIEYAESIGFKAQPWAKMTIDDLKKCLDEGKPVLCVIQAWGKPDVDYTDDWEDGHYVVAMGYDTEKVYFMDPSTLGHYTYIPVDEFLLRWHDRDRKEVLEHFGIIFTKGTPTYDPSVITKME